MIPRFAERVLVDRLSESAAVLLLGPRQVGKTTSARAVAEDLGGEATDLDLERPADRRRPRARLRADPCAALGVEQAYVVRPDSGGDAHSLGEGIESIGVTELVTRLRELGPTLDP